MPIQNSISNGKVRRYSTNALNNGIFTLSSLELKEGDTLVLAQLGDPCLPKGLLARLPKGVEIINLDFSEFENESYSFEMKEGYSWENDPEWPCEYLDRGNVIPFRKFSKEFLGLAKSRPDGTVKCFFDLSNYPIGTLEPVSPDSRSSKIGYRSRRREASLGQPSTRWDWNALDELIAESVRSSDPMQWNRAAKWGPFLYSAFANLICENGLSATILPEAYLRDASYLQARNSFLGDRSIRSVIYLGRTNFEQDYPAILLTSKRPNEGQIIFAFATLNVSLRANIAKKLSLNSNDAIFTAVAERMLHSAWTEDDRKQIGLERNWRFGANEQMLSRNEVRLDSTISDFYYSYRGYDAKLSAEAEKVQSYSAAAMKRKSSGSVQAGAIEKVSLPNTDPNDKEIYSYFMFPWSAASRVEKVRLEKQLPEEHCLRPGDILITRVVRPSGERSVSDATGLTVKLIKEDDVLMGRHDSEQVEQVKWLCPTSCICIRPKTNDLIYSFALYEYLSVGHGKESLSAIAKIRGSFTWNTLSAIELPPELVSESSEWKVFRTEVKKVALPYFDAYRECRKAEQRVSTKLKEAGKALSATLK